MPRFVLLVIAASLLFSAGAFPGDGASDDVLEFRVIAGGFSSASDVDFIRGQDRLFVLDTGRHRLLELDAAGQRQDSLGGRGSGDAQFRQPAGLDATNGMRIYVADAGNGRVQLFERRLSYIASMKPPDDSFFTPALVAVNTFGRVFVYDEDRHRLLAFDSGGRLQDELPLSVYDELRRTEGVSGLSLGDDELLLLARGSENGALVHRLSTGGRYAGFFGQGEDIRALSTSGASIWAVTPSALLRYDAAGRLQQRYAYTMPLPEEGSPELRGLAVSRAGIYLLSSERLFFASL